MVSGKLGSDKSGNDLQPRVIAHSKDGFFNFSITELINAPESEEVPISNYMERSWAVLTLDVSCKIIFIVDFISCLAETVSLSCS